MSSKSNKKSKQREMNLQVDRAWLASLLPQQKKNSIAKPSRRPRQKWSSPSHPPKEERGKFQQYNQKMSELFERELRNPKAKIIHESSQSSNTFEQSPEHPHRWSFIAGIYEDEGWHD